VVEVTASTLVLRSELGAVVPGDHWSHEPDAVDSAVLRRCCGPALDIGCGPGRHVLALAEQGLPVLGIDVTPHVVSWARRRGALVLQRCVFARVPGAGRWKTALLLDGNIGIGADPSDLLRRVTQLLAPDGLVLVEVDPPGRPPLHTRARLEVHGIGGPWFAWTSVDADGLDAHASVAELVAYERWDTGGRHFAELRRAKHGPGP
jgi:SAM-dependent methyltransferase